MIDRLDAGSPEVQRFLAELAALPETTTAAEPSPELAALLRGVPAARARGGPRRATGWLVAAVAAVSLLVGAVGTGWAAASNQLPSPLQDAIADFSEHHLPFRVPHSSDDGRDGAPGVEKQELPMDRPAPRLLRSRTAGTGRRTLAAPARPGPPQRPLEHPVGGHGSDRAPTAAGTPTAAATPAPSASASPSPVAPSEAPATSPGTDAPTGTPTRPRTPTRAVSRGPSTRPRRGSPRRADPPGWDDRSMTDLPPEDAKLVTLARATRARTRAAEGAAVRDTDGRTYAGATVDLPSLQVSALQVCIAMAHSSGSRGLEAAVLLSDALALPESDAAALADFAGDAVVVHLADPTGTLRG